MEYQKKIKCELYRDSMQNYKKYAIPPAQLIIADVPYNVGNNFYGSNPMWYNGGDNKKGESKLAGKQLSILILILIYMNIFIFVPRCLKRMTLNRCREGEVVIPLV